MSKTITRAMLSEAAAQKTGISKNEVAAIGDAMFAMIGEALMAGEGVKLTTFGSLQVRPRAERLGRNPRTGTAHRISPRHTVIFTPSTQLRERLDLAVSAAEAKPKPRKRNWDAEAAHPR